MTDDDMKRRLAAAQAGNPQAFSVEEWWAMIRPKLLRDNAPEPLVQHTRLAFMAGIKTLMVALDQCKDSLLSAMAQGQDKGAVTAQAIGFLTHQWGVQVEEFFDKHFADNGGG